jgi:hypothetical protein
LTPHGKEMTRGSSPHRARTSTELKGTTKKEQKKK